MPNLCLGVIETSAWFATLGAYYLLFAAMRMAMLLQMRKPGGYTQADARRTEWVCGVLLLTSVFVLSGIVTLVTKGEGSFAYSNTFVYAMATFTFYALASSIASYARLRRHEDRLVAANSRVNLVVALISLFALEVAMLTAFGTAEDTDLRLVMPILTGTGIAAVIIHLGVRSLLGLRRSASGRNL